MIAVAEERTIDEIRDCFAEVILADDPPADARHWRIGRFKRGLRLADELEARIGSLQGKRVLDVGAAYGGDIAAMYARGACCVGADKFDHNYDHLKSKLAPDDDRLTFTQFDCMKRWPVASASFDAVISMGVLEMVEDLDAFFDEVVRVLKPGGVAMVYTGTAFRMVRRDALYRLPLISLLPTRMRRWVAERVFNRPYRFAISNHTYYSAYHIRRYVAKRGYEILPMKYARSPLMARLQRLPLARLWQLVVRYLAFDFVFVIPRKSMRA